MTSAPAATEPRAPFGRLLTAMVTPFAADGSLDLATARDLAVHLVDDQDNDGLVVNGTTGESPTTTDAEKAALLEAVVDAVGDRARVVAGVGTASTEHTCALARSAAAAGAHGLLVAAPYYSRPPQHGLLEHFGRVADSTDLPVMLYDIPHRSAVPIAEATLITLADHPRIVAVKDAKSDVVSSSTVLAATELAYYSGEDGLTLGLMAVGGVGLVGTSTHFTGRLARRMMTAFAAGEVSTALALHRRLLPVFTGVFAAQGCTLVKAGLALRGRPVGGLRAPQMAATDAERAAFAACLAAADL